MQFQIITRYRSYFIWEDSIEDAIDKADEPHNDILAIIKIIEC